MKTRKSLMKTFEEFREIAEGKYTKSDVRYSTSLMNKIKKLAIDIQKSKDTSDQIKMIAIQNGFIACMLSRNAAVNAK